MNERGTTELVSELATALAEALRHTKYSRVTVEITPRGSTIINYETLNEPAPVDPLREAVKQADLRASTMAASDRYIDRMTDELRQRGVTAGERA